MTTSSNKEVLEKFRKYNSPLIDKAETYIRGLSQLTPDRQPESHIQAPETEWRRQRDIQEALKGMGDIFIEVIRDLEKFGMYEESMKAVAEEVIEEEPKETCDSAQGYKNSQHFVRCWSKWWKYLRRKNSEHQGYWKYIWGQTERLSQRIEEVYYSAQDKFSHIENTCCEPCSCDSGTWTPAMSGDANIAGGTGGITIPGNWHWMRAGDHMMVSGSFALTPSATGTQTYFQATLPAAVSITTFGAPLDQVHGTVGGDGNHQRSGFVQPVT